MQLFLILKLENFSVNFVNKLTTNRRVTSPRFDVIITIPDNQIALNIISLLYTTNSFQLKLSKH